MITLQMNKKNYGVEMNIMYAHIIQEQSIFGLTQFRLESIAVFSNS